MNQILQLIWSALQPISIYCHWLHGNQLQLCIKSVAILKIPYFSLKEHVPCSIQLPPNTLSPSRTECSLLISHCIQNSWCTSPTSFRQAKSCIWKYVGVCFRFFTHLASSYPFCFTGISLCILVMKSISLGGLRSSLLKNSLHPLHLCTCFVMNTIWTGFVNNFCLSFSLGTTFCICLVFVSSSSELSPSDVSTFMTFSSVLLLLASSSFEMDLIC